MNTTIKQLDIFGEETDVLEIQKEKKQRQTIKGRFRAIYGYDKNHRCKDCKHHIAGSYHRKILHKCEMMGLTHSEATDIRLKDYACSLFEEGQGKRFL